MRRAARVDSNQPEIVEALRRFGAAVLVTSQLKGAMDLLVGYNGNTYIVEVKDGDKPPSQIKLTKGELKCKAMFEAVGVTYHVIKSVDEAIELINQ
jgi:threonine dehydrogenase-like Zn-dependent dehydrogenase